MRLELQPDDTKQGDSAQLTCSVLRQVIYPPLNAFLLHAHFLSKSHTQLSECLSKLCTYVQLSARKLCRQSVKQHVHLAPMQRRRSVCTHKKFWRHAMQCCLQLICAVKACQSSVRHSLLALCQKQQGLQQVQRQCHINQTHVPQHVRCHNGARRQTIASAKPVAGHMYTIIDRNKQKHE